MIGGIGLILVGTYADREIDHRLDVIGAQASEVVRLASKQQPERVLLSLPVNSCNAWEEYALAVKEAQSLSASLTLLDYLDHETPSTKASVRLLIDQRPSVFLHLARGARANHIEYVQRLQQMTEYPPQGGSTVSLVALGLCDARLNASDSAYRRTRIIDLLQFARDWADGGTFPPFFDYTRAIERIKGEIEHLINRHDLALTDMQELENALVTLDASPPRQEEILSRSLAQLGAALHQQGLRGMLSWEGITNPRFERGLTNLFSERVIGIRFYEEWASAIHGAKGCDAWSPEHQNEFAAQLDSTPTSFRTLGLPITFMMAEARSARARIRLMQCALHWARTGDKLRLEDPWGGQMNFSDSMNTLKVSSIGTGNRKNMGLTISIVKNVETSPR